MKRNGCTPQQNWKADSRWNSIRIGEFVAPTPRTMDYKVTHTPASIAEAGKALTINAQVAGSVFPDSVIIYTDKVSFWNEHNPYIKMKRTSGYTYQAILPAADIKEDCFKYNIIVCRGDSTHTYPAGNSVTGSSSGIQGSPLDFFSD